MHVHSNQSDRSAMIMMTEKRPLAMTPGAADHDEEPNARESNPSAPTTYTATGARAVLVRPGEGTPVWFLGNLMVVKATAESTNGAYGLLESLIPAGASPPLHIHHREDEAFWVLDGSLAVRCADEFFEAPAGSYVFLPRHVPHTFRVNGDTPARVLTLLTPGGSEAFFVEGGRPAERLTLPPAGRPDLAVLERVARKFDSEFIGPPLAPSNGAPRG